jgi:hypothetical protein
MKQIAGDKNEDNKIVRNNGNADTKLIADFKREKSEISEKRNVTQSGLDHCNSNDEMGNCMMAHVKENNNEMRKPTDGPDCQQMAHRKQNEINENKEIINEEIKNNEEEIEYDESNYNPELDSEDNENNNDNEDENENEYIDEEEEEILKNIKDEKELEKERKDIQREVVMVKFNTNVRVEKWEIDTLKDYIDEDEYKLMMKKYVDQMIMNEKKYKIEENSIDVSKWKKLKNKGENAQKQIQKMINDKCVKIVDECKVPVYNTVIDWLNIASEIIGKDNSVLYKSLIADEKECE